MEYMKQQLAPHKQLTGGIEFIEVNIHFFTADTSFNFKLCP
jgi:hypothetical protein